MPPQQIYANSKGGLINEGGVMSSEYSMYLKTFDGESLTILDTFQT